MSSPLFMDSLPTEEVDTLKILGFCFDRKLTWSSMILYVYTLSTENRGTIWCYKFSVCKYGSVAIMGASATD